MMYASFGVLGLIRVYGDSFCRHPLIFGVNAVAAARGVYSMATKSSISTQDTVGVALLGLQLCYDEM